MSFKSCQIEQGPRLDILTTLESYLDDLDILLVKIFSDVDT